MKRLLLVAPSLLALASCAPRYDLFLSWTVGGQDAADACGAFTSPALEAHLGQRDTADGAVVDEHVELSCTDGAATVPSAAFSDVKLELISKGTVYGFSRTETAEPGTSDAYEGNSAENPLALDIRVVRGRLTAHFTVVGESCEDAGVDTFTVKLAQVTSPLGEKVIAEDETVTCEDGDAVFTYAPVEVGNTYKVSATADNDLGTDGTGDAIVITGAGNNLVVDLTPQ